MTLSGTSRYSEATTKIVERCVTTVNGMAKRERGLEMEIINKQIYFVKI